MIAVAILTTPEFNAATVNPASVQFAGASPTKSVLTDVDGDGDVDLLLHFKAPETNIQSGDTSACLTGLTYDGQAIFGCDSIRTVGSDSDGDSGSVAPGLFDDGKEASLGTDQFDGCADAGNDNAWPPDLTNDTIVNYSDVETFRGSALATLGDQSYQTRLDLVFDGYINVLDTLTVKSYLLQTCVNPGPNTDHDNDGFPDVAEQSITTDQFDSCPDNTVDDAWPPDTTNNRAVNVLDVMAFVPHLLSLAGDGRYRARLDLSANGVINTLDILTLRPYLLTTCSN